MTIHTTKNSKGTFAAAVDTFSDTGVGTPIEFTFCEVTVQLLGTATAVSVRVERSTVYPGADGSLGNWGPVDDALTGDLTAGVNSVVYIESDHAWWRVNAATVTSGTLITSVSGAVV